MKNFKKLIAVIIAIIVVMSSMSTVLLGTLVSADTAALPSATVTDLTVAELLATNAPPLTFAKKFVADEAAEDTLTAYSSWYADFVLTVNKDVTFNANGNADGYLAGHYGDYGWISVPFENVTLTAGTSLKIMEYAAELMNKAGLKFTYKEVYELVKEFKCGVFFDEEFLAANSDLEVTLELNIYNPEDETVSYTIHEKETFVPSKAIVYPDAPSATVTDIDIKELAENDAPELTFAKKFVADAAADNTVDAYGAWYADFVLTINKTVTFNANGTADGYLAGFYGDYGWISVPFEDITLEANTPLNIMEYAAKMMGQDALNITYNDVLNFVKEFSCGVFFSEEFLAANPDVKVDLGLNVFSPVDKDIEYTVHEKEPFVLSDAIVYSDVNIDGAVDAADMTLVRKALIGTAVAESWYNVNVDNSFDVRDLVRVKKDAAEILASQTAAAEALAAALAAGGEVVLNEDFVLPEGFGLVIPEGVTATLDLNGHTIDAGYQTGSTTNHTYAITNKGTLTILGEGTINTRGIHNYGDITLENGTINAIDGNGGYGVRNYAGATLTINGGTIATTLEDDHLVNNGGYDATPVRVDNGASFVMNGGELKNICDFTFALENAGTATINDGKLSSVHTTVANYGTLTINDGEIFCNGLEGITAHTLWANSGNVTINGGSFDGKDNYNGFSVDTNAGAVVNIYGGNFLPVHSGSLYGDGTINVYGGTYADDPSAYVADDYKAIDNGDGTYTVIAAV